MDTKEKWTTGPWKVLGDPKLAPINIANEAGAVVAYNVFVRDANVLAAAPEMAEALSEAYDIVFNTPRREVDAITWQEWGEKAKVALRKARGEQE